MPIILKEVLEVSKSEEVCLLLLKSTRLTLPPRAKDKDQYPI
jgi:hypothetical protein